MDVAISVLVPTYGRTHVLTECIESFLRQDFAGRAEMIILNDHPEQRLAFGGPATPDSRRVTVLNASERYPDLGTKRNALLSRASHSMVAFWDDDDIYLPTALSRMTERYMARVPLRRSGRESHCWQLQPPGGNDGVSGRVNVGDDLDLIVRDAGTLWSMIIERSAISAVGGFPPYDRLQDVELLKKLIQHRWVAAETNTPGIPSCIHRLAGTPYAHAVDFTGWHNIGDNAASAAFHERATAELMNRGAEPRGGVTLYPSWQFDYVALTKAAWTIHNPLRTLPREGDPPSA